MDEYLMTLKEFISLHVGPDQMQLVEYLMDHDDDDQIQDGQNLHNYIYFTAYLKQGVFKDNTSGFNEKIISVENDIEELQCRYNRSFKRCLLTEIDQLNLEIKRLENAEFTPREVKSWFTVTAWIGNALLVKGEALLQAHGVTWWGRCSKGPLWDDKTIMDIFTTFEARNDVQ